MKAYKIFFTVILAAISFTNAQQNYNFKKFAESEKLSNTQVNDFFQDSYGFMWIATRDGLNRGDGKSVKIYKNIQGDDESLPDNEVFQVIEDRDKNIWVACFNLIGKLDRKTDKFIKYTLDKIPFKGPPRFYDSMLDKEGRIWFALNELGLIRYDKNTDQFVNIALDSSNAKTVWGEVHSIVQLRNGLILAADLSSGIKSYNASTDKFDSYYLKPNYSPDKIFSIFEESSGSIWFTGEGRALKYSPSQYIVKEINFASLSKIKTKYAFHNRMIEDEKGNLWLSVYTHGYFKFDNQLKKIEQYVNEPGNINSIPNNMIAGSYKDKYGIIWLTFQEGGVYQLDPSSSPFEIHSINLSIKNIDQTISRIVPFPENQSILLLGSAEGLIKYDSKLKKAESININDVAINSDSTNLIHDLAVDYKHNIWYSVNSSQLRRYNLKSGAFEEIISPHFGKTAQPLRILAIDISPDNKVWISSNYGVDIYDPITKEFFPLPRIMNKKISQVFKDDISNIRNSRNPLGSILEVGEGQNLEKVFNLEKKTRIIVIANGEGRASSGMFDVGSLANAEGKPIWDMLDIYKTFYNGGGFKNRIGIKLLELEKGDYKLSYKSDIGHSYKNWNTLSPDDSLYWGIEVYEVNETEFKVLKSRLETELDNKHALPMEMGIGIHFSKTNQNIIWIKTDTHSFIKYDLQLKTYIQYNHDKENLTSTTNLIYTIHEDLDGILWLGTYSSLIRFNPITEELHSFTTDNGLPGGIVYDITEDNNGALWIYSSGGLSKLNKNAPLDKYTFVNYDSQDGLERLTIRSQIINHENGDIYLGGQDGIISFTPGSINIVEPDIVVYDFKIDDISVFDDSSDFKLDSGILETDIIKLSYNQNNIAFDFSSIHFSRPGKNKISYKLDGFKNKWYESDRSFASFTNLDPGDYTFWVKGSNGDGLWNETGRKIRIVINPPWWQTTYAYLSYAAFLILGVFAIDRIQRRRLLSKARERMKMQEAVHRAEAAELQSRAIQAENERKTKELEEARHLQLSMLPKNLPNLPHLDIAVYMQTATEVGGDYYDFHIAIDGTLTVVIGDATGHGMKAGTMVTSTKTLFNTLAPNPDIVETFHEMTRCLKLMQMEKLSMCLTMLKITGNKIQMSSAGMPPVFIYKRENQTIEEHVIKGMPLGTFSDFPYSIVESSLSAGDTILLMSDGFPELQNDEKEMYGYKRARNYFEEIAGQSPEEIISKLKTAGSEWVKDADPDDDVTFVVIKVK